MPAPTIVTNPGYEGLGTGIVYGDDGKVRELVLPEGAVRAQLLLSNESFPVARVYYSSGDIREYVLLLRDGKYVVDENLMQRVDRYTTPQPCGAGECVLGTVVIGGAHHIVAEPELADWVFRVRDEILRWRRGENVHPDMLDDIDSMDEWELFCWHASLFQFCPNCGRMADCGALEKVFKLGQR